MLGFFGVLAANPAVALNESTHAIINEQAVRRPAPGQISIDQVFKEQLGFLQGIEERFLERRVFEWVREGGAQENSPLCRTARHFHDPLQPWPDAGLRTVNPLIAARCGAFSYASSVHWSQDPNQTIGARASWQDARQFFHTALITPKSDPTQTERDQAFADTFRALGQVMHLVVDASVLEHVAMIPTSWKRLVVRSA
jgi:hypothetical protein